LYFEPIATECVEDNVKPSLKEELVQDATRGEIPPLFSSVALNEYECDTAVASGSRCGIGFVSGVPRGPLGGR
jgi:hypothetical protein